MTIRSTIDAIIRQSIKFASAILMSAFLSACESGQRTDDKGSSLETSDAAQQGIDLEHEDTEMQRAFRSVFKADLSAVIYLPQETTFGPTGKTIPFSIAPLAFERTAEGAILVTAAVSENDSARLIPGSDVRYIGIYYLQPNDRGFKVDSSYPTALGYMGSTLPVVSRRFTGEPVLVARGLNSFTWMGESRYWDELYALKGGKPDLLGVIPTFCAQTDPKDNDKYYETTGFITEIQPKAGFTVKYRGDVNGIAKWKFHKGKFVLVSPYPKTCDHDYAGAITSP